MPAPTSSDAHQPVVATGLPKPVGPYSPAMMFDRLVFVSGQGATDPVTGRLAGLDVETQTEQVFRNIRAILEAAGTAARRIFRRAGAPCPPAQD